MVTGILTPNICSQFRYLCLFGSLQRLFSNQKVSFLLGEVEQKVSLYADDALMFIANPEKTVAPSLLVRLVSQTFIRT